MEHLPECLWTAKVPSAFRVCICYRLLACEQRVLTKPVMAWRDEERAAGYARGLADARGEVALALVSVVSVHIPPEEHNAVLAAIDALGGDA